MMIIMIIIITTTIIIIIIIIMCICIFLFTAKRNRMLRASLETVFKDTLSKLFYL